MRVILQGLMYTVTFEQVIFSGPISVTVVDNTTKCAQVTKIDKRESYLLSQLFWRLGNDE